MRSTIIIDYEYKYFRSELLKVITQKNGYLDYENKIYCEIKKSDKILVYIKTSNRFITGFHFYGKFIPQGSKTLVKGFFIIPVVGIFFYAFIFFITIYSFSQDFIYSIISFLLALVVFIIDLLISLKYRNRIQKFFLHFKI
jgi:hypothetical protein